MEIFISSSVIGVFATDENGKYIDSVIFHDKHADHFKATQSEEPSKDELKLIKNLKNQGKIIFETKKEGYDYVFPNPSGTYLRDNLKKVARTYTDLDCLSLNKIIHDANMKITSSDIKSSIHDDTLIIQAVSSIDDLSKIVNQMTMRLREWYGLYYPEFAAKCSSANTFVRIVATETERENIKSFPQKESIGADIDKEDLLMIKSYAEKINSIYTEIEKIERYVESKTSRLLPSTSKLINPLLAARLISQAGSTDKLAAFPSSTIQV
ncbi:MAG: hypothetical protein KAR20_15945, partial [Candidatus Heimdallarchaeota archaeon]|nr:hypothetical protein [Candidatus Heimdallarchaeota archaeon]